MPLAAAVFTGLARFALPARLEDLDRDPVPGGQPPPLRRPAPDRLDYSNGLVAGYECEPTTQFSGVLLVIGSAQPARLNADQPVVVADIEQRQRLQFQPARRVQHQRPRGSGHQPAEPALLNSANS